MLYDINLKISKNDASKWRKIIKTCKFECWDCNFCDRIAGGELDKKAASVAEILITSVNSDFKTSVPGLSSPRIDKMLNELGKISTAYLEIGCLSGRTFSSTIAGNKLNAYAVDLWKEGIAAENGSIDITVTKDDFIRNILPHRGENKIKIFNCDFIDVDKSGIKNVDLFLYDGDHSYESTKLAVEYFSDTFAEECILIFDDANWTDTLTGADEGLAKAGLEVAFSRKIINSIESRRDWWNGLYIVVTK